MQPSDAKILAFIDQVAWGWIVYRHHQKLYESGTDRLSLLERSGVHFFVDLQNILSEYSYLQICRLTDRGAKNLSINSLLEDCRGDREIYEQLVPLVERMIGFRKRIAPARNKVIAHADHKTLVKAANVGSFPAGADVAFWRDMQAFVDVLHGRYVGGPYPILDMVMLDDVDDLVRVLRAGVAAEETRKRAR